MAQLWSAQTVLLQAALQDRYIAQQQRVAAEQATAAAVKEQQRLQQLEEDEKVALRAINDRHAAKAEAARQDYEQLKLQHEKVGGNRATATLAVGSAVLSRLPVMQLVASVWLPVGQCSRQAWAESWASLVLEFSTCLRLFAGAPAVARASEEAEWSAAACTASHGPRNLQPAAGQQHTAATGAAREQARAAGTHIHTCHAMAGQGAGGGGAGCAAGAAAGCEHTAAEEGPWAVV